MIVHMYPPIPMSPNFQPNFTLVNLLLKNEPHYNWTKVYRDLAQPKEEAIKLVMWNLHCFEKFSGFPYNKM